MGRNVNIHINGQKLHRLPAPLLSPGGPHAPARAGTDGQILHLVFLRFFSGRAITGLQRFYIIFEMIYHFNFEL
ncbi:MAG: hypothetical protein KG003_02205 [Bacteroidetes bacterium]|nr:hypothetical protein [Bacteroidota bacterium]